MKINHIYGENCLKTMSGMNDEVIDLTVTSPPYDKLREYNGYSFEFENIARELYRITKTGGVIVWIVGDSVINGGESCTSFAQVLYFIQGGFRLHDTMIWNKGSFTNPSSNRYHQVFEYMFVLSKGKPKTFNPIKDRKNKYLGKRGASGRDKDGKRRTGYSEVKNEYGQRFNIWNIPVGGGISYKGKNKHPAIFPEKLARDHILSWSNPGDLVYDPFMGSGTTAVACVELGRDYVGSEISQEYCLEARKRVEKYEPLLRI